MLKAYSGINLVNREEFLILANHENEARDKLRKVCKTDKVVILKEFKCRILGVNR